MLKKPMLKEFIVTHVSLIEEIQPSPLQEEIQQELPNKIEPIVEKKPEKKVSKALGKTTLMQKIIQKPSTQGEHAVSQEPLQEQKEAIQATVRTEKEIPHASTSERKEDLLLVYLSKVRLKIQGSLRYPSMAKKMGMEGEAIIQFLIHTNGMVDASSIKITKSSGKAVLDRNAIDAVMEALPFEVPPHEDIEIKVPVVFKLTS